MWEGEVNTPNQGAKLTVESMAALRGNVRGAAACACR